MAEFVSDSTKCDAIDILTTYVDFIRNEVRADDFERHPYVPHIEQTIEDLRAAPPAMDREAVKRTVKLVARAVGVSVMPDGTAWALVFPRSDPQPKLADIYSARQALSTLSADAIRHGETIGLDGIKRLWRIGVETGSILERANPQPWCSGVATDVPAGEVRRNPDDPDWDKCPACKTGSLDTGYECNACGFDAQPLVHLRDACAARGERMHPSGLYESEIAHPFPATPASDGGKA